MGRKYPTFVCCCVLHAVQTAKFLFFKSIFLARVNICAVQKKSSHQFYKHGHKRSYILTMSHFFLFMEENLELCKLESPAFLRNVISGLLRFSVSDVTSKSKKNRLEQFSCISLQLHRDFYSYTPRKSCDI